MRFRSALFATVAAAVLATPTLAGFAGTDVFLPMVGRQAGIHPSNWYTTVWLYNPGAEAVTAQLYLLQRGTSNPSPPRVDVLVAPGDTEKLDNVIETYFHAEMFGALRVICPAKLVVTSRVYSKATGAGEQDSVGQDFAGVPASFAIGSGEKSQILGVHQTLPSAESKFRYNFGLVETTGHLANVRVTAYDENNASQGSTDVTVRAWSQGQWAFKDRFPAVSTESSRLEVEVISGTGRVIAYGSGIANGSQDPTTYEMTYADKALGIPTVQHDATLTGDGTAAVPLGIAPSPTAGQVLTTIGGGSPAPGGVVAAAAGNTVAWQSVGALSLGLTPGGVTFGGASGALAQDAGSIFWDNASKRLGLGTATPAEQLELTGNLQLPLPAASGGLPTAGAVKVGALTVLHTYGLQNTFLGPAAGNFAMTGIYNTGAGAQSLGNNTSGISNTAIGAQALMYNTEGSANTAVGEGALTNNTLGYNNTGLGRWSLHSNTLGNGNTATGAHSMWKSATGSSNSAFGASSLQELASGNSNTAIGHSSLEQSTTGATNTAVGESSLRSIVDGSENTAVGAFAGFNTLGWGNVFLGYNAGRDEKGSSRLYIANSSAAPLIYGQFDTRRVGINTTATGQTLSVGGTLGIAGGTGFTVLQGSAGQPGDIVYTLPPTNTDGYLHNNAGFLTWDSGGPAGTGTAGQVAIWTGSTLLGGAVGTFWDAAKGRLGLGTAAPSEQLELTGNLALPATSPSAGQIKLGGERFLHASGARNTFVGAWAGNLTMDGADNTAIGHWALGANASGYANTAVGRAALQSNIGGYSNAAVGYGSMSVNTVGAGNAALGDESLKLNETGDDNTAVGDSSMFQNKSGSSNTAVGRGSLLSNVSGTKNVAVGYRAGYAALGSSNVFVGPEAGFGETGSNRLYIANSSGTPLIFGRFDTSQVGINTVAPGFTLEVNGTAGKPGGGSWASPSDARLKRNIAPLRAALARLLQLQGVAFEWVNPEQHGGRPADQGFIAQDVARVFPEWVEEVEPAGADNELVGPEDKVLALSLPFAFDAYVVEAIKEQQAEIAALRATVAELKQQLTELRRLAAGARRQE